MGDDLNVNNSALLTPHSFIMSSPSPGLKDNPKFEALNSTEDSPHNRSLLMKRKSIHSIVDDLNNTLGKARRMPNVVPPPN